MHACVCVHACSSLPDTGAIDHVIISQLICGDNRGLEHPCPQCIIGFYCLPGQNLMYVEVLQN